MLDDKDTVSTLFSFDKLMITACKNDAHLNGNRNAINYGKSLTNMLEPDTTRIKG